MHALRFLLIGLILRLCQGAFIAGVQAQVVAYTFDKNYNNLQVAANGFGFVGLALDVLGTSFGVLHALKLHRSIQRMPTLLQARSREQLDDMRIQCEADTTAAVQILEAELSARKKFWVVRPPLFDASIDKSLHDHLWPLFHHNQSTVQSYLLRLFSAAGAVPHTATLGMDPLLAMGGGIVCLLVSVMCFAAYTQHKVVWVACIAITTIMASSMICGMWIHHEGMSFTIYVAVTHSKLYYLGSCRR